MPQVKPLGASKSEAAKFAADKKVADSAYRADKKAAVAKLKTSPGSAEKRTLEWSAATTKRVEDYSKATTKRMDEHVARVKARNARWEGPKKRTMGGLLGIAGAAQAMKSKGK